MLRHSNLYDPIGRSEIMQDEDFTKYVEIREAQSGPTPPELVDEIRKQFFSFAKSVVGDYEDEMAKVKKVWDFIEPKLKENQGLAQFTLDYDGASSDFFFPWLVSVFRSPARALEMSYGVGYDLSGNWSSDTIDDPIDYFVKNDPTFVYNRERQLRVADLASTIYENAWENHSDQPSAKIVDFGAGMLAWARWHGYDYFEPRGYNLVELYAFDKDPSIKPDELFNYPLDQIGIHYKHGDLFTQIKNIDCAEADLVILGGVASYIPSEAFEGKVVPAIYQLLKSDGTFFYDLQLDCPYLRRSIKLWDWPDMALPDSATVAIDAVEAMRKRLWSAGMEFSAEYAVDTYNHTPSAVMITLTKLD